MSSLEERDVGVAAAPGSSSAGLGVGAVGVAVEAVAGVAAMQEEVAIRREGPEPNPDEPPKKRVKLPEGEAGKLEERLYSVLCCTVCLDLPKASVYQVNMLSITNLAPSTHPTTPKQTSAHQLNLIIEVAHVSPALNPHCQPVECVGQLHLFLVILDPTKAPSVNSRLSHEAKRPDTTRPGGQLYWLKFIT